MQKQRRAHDGPHRAATRAPQPALALTGRHDADDAATLAARVANVLRWLEQTGTEANREGMARYAITSDKLFGVSVTAIRQHARVIGRNHALALAPWDTGSHEARTMAAFIDEPARVTRAQMDRWCRDFDNWAVCDTVCMHLFDRTAHAWSSVEKWSVSESEFVTRAAFALIASLAMHSRHDDDAPFLDALTIVERGSTDSRNFVKKAVHWALRAVGGRNVALNTAAVALAERLAASPDRAARWVGKDALRKFATPAMAKRLAAVTRAR